MTSYTVDPASVPGAARQLMPLLQSCWTAANAAVAAFAAIAPPLSPLAAAAAAAAAA
eukprot:CAMPEP_0171932032 /NCGR_PEP_ID=MMETSP0993-20121228/29975_1 /TAXON_ID=483369 /ORGANISM="non described non described, Strain CCMP2098" /LENGTH=56 /DNA_ID=CAMNT_0012572207 /DNA_START=339 /DNA_END=506 /DNA_ORIENTATION=+